MWICRKCGEESEDNFTACWNCQSMREGVSRPRSAAQTGESPQPEQTTLSRSHAVERSGEILESRHPEYLVVPFVGSIKYGFFSSQNAGEVSKQLQAVINDHALRGWEFHSLEKVDVAINPGCLPWLFGAKSSYVTFDQLVFRRK